MASIYKRSKRKNSIYSIQYYDHEGKRRTVKGFTDRGLSEQLAGKLEAEARLRLTGLVDVEQERLAKHKGANLECSLDVFAASLDNNTAKHVELTMLRIRRIVIGCGFKKLGDLAREPVENFLRQLCRDEGIGNRTFNHYAQAIDSFCNWCVATQRLLRNPLVGIERRNTEVDVRHPRRALAPDEISRLIVATRGCGKKAQNLSPETRARAYLFAYLTGLRKKEMASLTQGSFRLDDAPPTVTVSAACSKHRRRDVLPLHPKLVGMLQDWLRDLRPDEPLFPLLERKMLSEMIQKDLKRAGIPYRTAEGFADFHAAGRHTYITQLLRSGASLPEAKELARHTDVKMTMRYTHIGIQDQAKAVAKLPAPLGIDANDPAAQRNRGRRALHRRCSFGGAEGHSVSSAVIEPADSKRENPCESKGLVANRRQLATGVTAEGTGLEPATGYPARHFQCRR
jgi:integrase